jgi:putative flavoprotein involved in K+ transport
MTDTAVYTPPTITSILDDWLDALVVRMRNHDVDAVRALLSPGCTTRDLLALSWDFRNGVGAEESAQLLAGADATAPVSIERLPAREPVVEGEDGSRTIRAFLAFRNEVGGGEGFVQLAETSDGWRADAFVLTLSSLDSHPAQVDSSRPVGRIHGAVEDRPMWSEQRDHEFETEDPTVVIVGAGHNGLILAARLRSLGIAALIVERNQRVGDNWRNRYSSLALHTPIASDNFPYLPFPPTWTKFTVKDKLADFLDSYATLLDLPVWTGSRVENVHFDATGRNWKLDVVRADGGRRTLRPGHLVFATGLNASPLLPKLQGSERFRGSVMHAVEYRGATAWRGKKAVVVGCGVSGHDIAQDLAEHGVNVTMVQRSATVVLDAPTFHKVMHSNHIDGRFTTDEADLINAATPFGELPNHGAAQLTAARELDAEMLAGLERAGFKLGSGPNGQGVLGLIFGQNATGYYYNAGASDMIIDGRIKLAHGDVVGLTEDGIELGGGETVDAELVVFATGYKGPSSVVGELLGEDVAEELGEFYNVGADREYGRLWRRSGRDRLWFMISLDIAGARFYSKSLALQIAAIEAGTIPDQAPDAA